MANPHGTPIWYELLADDADASKAFYEAVIGWTVHPAEPGGMDYRMIDAGAGDFVGGLMQLAPEMKLGGAMARWLFYIGVDDVDAAAAKITAAGGAIHLPPFDMAGAGRMAMAADPQGNPFYIMRGESDAASTAWDSAGIGKCSWNELATSDPEAGNAFYADVFGWTYPDTMTMPGDMGDYVFVTAGDAAIGATMRAMPGQPTGWQFYFRAPDVEAAAAAVTAHGGTVMMGPQDVPGGDRIIVATDPAGVVFGVVGPGE